MALQCLFQRSEGRDAAYPLHVLNRGAVRARRSFLQSSWIFSYTNEAQLESIAQRFLVRQCRDGDYIVAEGKTCDSMVVLATGHIEEINHTYDTKRLWEVRVSCMQRECVKRAQGVIRGFRDAMYHKQTLTYAD